MYITRCAACEQAWTLLLLGPFLDRYISHAWVFNYDCNVPALTFLTLSCACAVGVNVSQFMCLGRFSAVSYQVRSHRKMRLSAGRFRLTSGLQLSCISNAKTWELSV